MKIKNPCIITPRLLTGVQIDKTFISIDYMQKQDFRFYYAYWIDLPNGYTYSAADISSPRASLQEALCTLLSFLSAFAEAEACDYEDSENRGMFPEELTGFATQNSDEISMLAIELEEIENIIDER